MPTLAQRLRAVEAALEGPERFRDMRLDLVRPDGLKALVAGGRFDRTFNRFLDPATEGDAETAAVIELQESQVEVVEWFAEWLCAFRDGYPRDVQLAMLAGDRRGGKSFALLAMVLACCIDVPITRNGTPLIAWLVAKTYRERFELEQWILTRVPAAWYRHQAAPEHQFHFVHGPTLRLLSADDPDSLKQGRCDIAGVNEPQKMAARALANIVLGVSDLGGLTILAANPPSGADSKGEWLFDVKEALDDERVAAAQGKPVDPLGVKYFHVDSKRNKAIDQLARRKAGRLAALIDPTIQAGDVEGSWKRPQPRACWEFDKHKHLHALPEPQFQPPDVTARIAQAAGFYGGAWQAVAGVDFQDKPHIVSTIWRAFGDADAPIFWAVGELAGEKRWTEEQYLNEFAATFPEYDNRSLAWVGDASGSWQDAPHSGKRTSFDVWHEPPRGWLILPPQDPRSDKQDAKARNPFVDDQLQLVNELLRTDRIRIDPVRCPWLAECFREAITKRTEGRRKIVQNKHAHALAASLYALWRLAGRLRHKAAPPPRGSMRAIEIPRTGPKLFGR